MIIVGIDWARGKHGYLLMAPTGQILQRGRIPHNATGLQELAARIDQHACPERNTRVGIEMNDGAMLAWVMEKGYTVLRIQPRSAHLARDIYRPSGGKDDPVDTSLLAQPLSRVKGEHGDCSCVVLQGRSAMCTRMPSTARPISATSFPSPERPQTPTYDGRRHQVPAEHSGPVQT